MKITKRLVELSVGELQLLQAAILDEIQRRKELKKIAPPQAARSVIGGETIRKGGLRRSDETAARCRKAGPSPPGGLTGIIHGALPGRITSLAEAAYAEAGAACVLAFSAISRSAIRSSSRSFSRSRSSTDMPDWSFAWDPERES